MAGLPYGINAWIFLKEDGPPGTNYNSADSCFQSLIQYKVYNSLDFLGIAFFEVVPGSSGFTIKIGNGCHLGNADNPNNLLSNQDYLTYVLRDARKVNPDIKFLATMIYKGDQTLSAIFSSGNEQTQATDFANNLVIYLKKNGMNGLDVDWEGDVADRMTQSQFKILFSTIRQVFDQQPEKYYLTMAPAWDYSVYDFPTLKSTFDVVSPQFYDGTTLSEFLGAGMSPDNIGYGAQFEPGNEAPNTSAQQVWSAVSPGFNYQDKSYNYQDIFMWRLNSGNYQFEQAQLMILSQLANPPAGDSFDDTAIVAAAGNPNITRMTVRAGEVLNAIQAVNTGTGPYNTGTQNTETGIFTLLQHGGNSGGAQTINIPIDDPIISITGYTGKWYGWECVLQLTLTGKSGATYGPFGTMAGSTTQTHFTQSAQPEQSVVAFSGSTVTVPLADGSHTAIIASLNAVFA
ncbi:glycosyl hydrolase family 18 protein [Desulfobacter vibrioformis]|uniref:glycosyl hydrolase family 18 protein n=1 Tax=Desulfobacter vibrioformis TaxID=34031 RepID=UPI00054D885A|nr:glycosyl hydrolase family 18 protein [Desulfobacter vibrioformis]